MKALVLNENELSVKEIKLHSCNERKGFFMSIIASGICGTDLHIIEKKNNRKVILGHEFYGVITKISEGVCIKSLNGEVGVGDLVTVVPGIACENCEYCKMLPSNKNYCLHRKVYGMNFQIGKDSLILGGNMHEIFIPVEYGVYKINHSWKKGLGTLLEPVSVSVKAVKRALKYSTYAQNRNLWAMVVGIGTIGFFICMALKKRGINVIAVDTNEGRRMRALRNGIQYVFESDEIGCSNYNMLKEQKMMNLAPDMVFEAVGAPDVLKSCIEWVRKGGVVLEVGNFIDMGTTNISPSVICNKEIVLIGSVLADENSYPEAEILIDDFKNNCEEVIYNYSINEYKQAFIDARNRNNVLKCNLVF